MIIVKSLISPSFKKAASVALSSIIAVVLMLWSIASTPSADAALITTVTATVTNTVTCATLPGSTAFGTLSSGSVTTASPNATTTLSCNSGGGCTLYVADAGNASNPGLYAAAATGTPLILSSTATLSAGTEGYGIQAATTSAGTGSALTLSAIYLKTGNAVGGLNLAATQIASTTSPISSKEVIATHLAAIGVLTKSGSYADTVTYSCIGN